MKFQFKFKEDVTKSDKMILAGTLFGLVPKDTNASITEAFPDEKIGPSSLIYLLEVDDGASADVVMDGVNKLPFIEYIDLVTFREKSAD